LFNYRSTSSISSLSLHDALPIWREMLDDLFSEIASRRDELVEEVEQVMVRDRGEGLVTRYGREDAAAVVDGFRDDLMEVLERWWRRVEQLNREYRGLSGSGSSPPEARKAAARKRADRE